MSQTTEKRDEENDLRRLGDIQTTLEKVLGEGCKKVTEELGTKIPEIRKILETTLEKVLNEEVQKVTEELGRIFPEMKKIFETTLEKVPGEGCKKVTDELDRRIPDFSKILETTLKKVLGEECQKVTDELSRIISEKRKIVEDNNRQIYEPKEEMDTALSPLPSTNDPNETKEQSSENKPGPFTKLYNVLPSNPFKTKPKKSVQIIDPTNTKSSMKFAYTLTERLKKEFKCLTINTEGVENGIPLIVVCTRSTRLKPDVESALSKVSYSAKRMVLIVHTGAESNLPAVPSSQKLGGNWKNVEFIDMGFDVDYGGIYDCCHNKEGLERLSEYINAFPYL